jgi:hypothetical protein
MLRFMSHDMSNPSIIVLGFIHYCMIKAGLVNGSLQDLVSLGLLFFAYVKNYDKINSGIGKLWNKVRSWLRI